MSDNFRVACEQRWCRHDEAQGSSLSLMIANQRYGCFHDHRVECRTPQERVISQNGIVHDFAE